MKNAKALFNPEREQQFSGSVPASNVLAPRKSLLQKPSILIWTWINSGA